MNYYTATFPFRGDFHFVTFNSDMLANNAVMKDDFDDYANGVGVDPVGGVEAIISHYISRELKVPCAHSPALDDMFPFLSKEEYEEIHRSCRELC